MTKSKVVAKIVEEIGPGMEKIGFPIDKPKLKAVEKKITPPAKKQSIRTKNKALKSIWIDNDVVDWFRSTGSGWMTRMNAVLREHMEKSK